jgi:acetamidase/formamidase
MKRLPRSKALVYALDGSLPPALHVDQGEAFLVETEDASSGLLADGTLQPTTENLPYVHYSPARANPVGGPISVSGIKKGDRVRVDILGIDLASTGVSYNRPPLSPVSDSRTWPDAAEAFSVLVQHHEGEAIISDRLRWRLAPMIGTLCCAPEWEVRASSAGQGSWGGNLDVADFRPGSSVFLNCYHDGALVFVGDVHGCQGDGEYYAVADESRSEVTLRVQAVAGEPLPAPRVISDSHVVALGMDKPLEAASHAAIQHLMRWLIDEYAFSARDAYLTIGLHPDFRLRTYQMIAAHGVSYVVGATLPREFVEPSQPR